MFKCNLYSMASGDNKLIERIAFCSLLCAGFAYAGYTVVTNMRHKKLKKKEHRFAQTYSLKFVEDQSTQTDDLPEFRKCFDEGYVSPKSVKERVSDLNQSERLRKRSIPISPEVKMHSFHGTPWTSPLGCAKFLSVSAENINSRLTSPPEKYKRKGHLTTSHSVLNVELQSKLLNLDLVDKMAAHISVEDETISLKSLSNLQKSPSQMTLFEVKNLIHLLHSLNEDILLKTLFTISNCAAFTTNQQILCESDCPKKLKDLLLSPSESIKIAVTQAISNISVIEKSHRYFQMHIPILLNNAVNSRELLKSLSLTALANLALDPASHKMMIKHVQPITTMVRNGTDVVQLQAVRLLVNLSCNENVIPALLMSEFPSDFMDMLNPSCDRELLLRLLTFLSNVVVFIRQFVGSSSKSTLLSVLYSFNKNFKDTTLMTLSSVKDDDISFQAKRLQGALTGLT